jgi:hypothetical protein
MNKLTTPPPVEELDPQYAEDLRSELVKSARGSRRQRSAWTPILAAACGVAVITGGVVASTRSGDSPEPASSPAPSATSAVVQKVPAASSERVNLDRGSVDAFGPESQALVKRCLAEKRSALGEPNNATSADLDDAAVYTARWQQAVPGEGGVVRPTRTKYLLQNLITKTGIRVQCLDSTLLQSFDPALAGIPWDRSRYLSKVEAVNGVWSFREIPDGGSSLLYVGYSFSALPSVTKVEIRIRWTGGASPWYAVPVDDGTGYVAASQLGAAHRKHAMEVDYRALDRNGRVVFSDIEYG